MSRLSASSKPSPTSSWGAAMPEDIAAPSEMAVGGDAGGDAGGWMALSSMAPLAGCRLAEVRAGLPASSRAVRDML